MSFIFFKGKVLFPHKEQRIALYITQTTCMKCFCLLWCVSKTTLHHLQITRDTDRDGVSTTPKFSEKKQYKQLYSTCTKPRLIISAHLNKFNTLHIVCTYPIVCYRAIKTNILVASST